MAVYVGVACGIIVPGFCRVLIMWVTLFSFVMGVYGGCRVVGVRI